MGDLGQNNQYRLLMLWKLLYEETDETHQLSMAEIIDKLKRELPHMKMDPRTIRTDMATMNRFGLTIEQTKGKYGKNMYSYRKHLFDRQEMRILIDMIMNTRNIAAEEKQRLIEKLKTLTSSHIAADLPDLNTPLQERALFHAEIRHMQQRVHDGEKENVICLHKQLIEPIIDHLQHEVEIEYVEEDYVLLHIGKKQLDTLLEWLKDRKDRDWKHQLND